MDLSGAGVTSEAEPHSRAESVTAGLNQFHSNKVDIESESAEARI